MKPSANEKAPLQKGRRRVLALALTSALLVAGCATPRLSPVDANAYWSGRMAIRVLKDPPESLSAGFELQGSAKAGEMVLLSPIGTTLARLDWTPQGAHLAQGQQQVSSPSLQKLGARLTGTELPIAALFEWLAGRPAEAPGWQVDLSAHAQGRISAERREPSPGAVLRIALDR
uniref:lipoprotein insertase outer membrane protein LolB n=1 Tax=Limnohabitans sp. TaxID=1907725 RepID=UPI0040477A5D